MATAKKKAASKKLATAKAVKKRAPAKTTATENRKVEKLTLEECVRAFLGLVWEHPVVEPKTQRAQRDNEMIIHGVNKAQETLRGILETHGRTAKVREVAEVRKKGQQRPTEMAGMKVWIL